MTCARCGGTLPDGARFCPSCGSRVAEDAATEERKLVTVVFVDLVGSTSTADRADPEDVHARLSTYFASVRRDLEQHGATVEKFIGDAVVALFGAPVAHGDDPERAVRAGLAILAGLDELNRDDPRLGLEIRVGIETGEAVVAVGVRAAHGEGFPVGDVLNTCARLQEAAPTNGILVGEGTYGATSHVFDYREAEPVRAKGKAERLRVWEPVAPRFGIGARLRLAAPLVGREPELKVLLDALRHVRENREPQFVTLVGAAGIGKSRLVAELLATVEHEPDVVCRAGRSLPYSDVAPFSAVASIVKAEAGIVTNDTADEADRKLATAVSQLLAADEARWVEGHVRPLLGHARDGEAAAVQRSEEAFAAWRRLVEALAARRPLILVFEDLHWADDGVLDFVDHLRDWASGIPLLVVGTGRPELLERRPAWSGGMQSATTVELSPLSGEETAGLVRELLKDRIGGAEIGDELLAHAAGNPLYAEEYAHMVVDRDLIPGKGDDLPVPATVQGVIAARLDALGSDEKALVQDAAVIGKTSWLGALARVSGRSEEAVEPILAALERKDFLALERRSSVAGELEYSFRHVLAREVAYRQIPRSRRSEKHRLAAEWMESIAGNRESETEFLAHHYLSAVAFGRAAGHAIDNVANQARRALKAAGDRAAALGAHGAAASSYRAAVELVPAGSAERTDLCFRHGKALFNAGDRGEEELAEARDLLLVAGDRERTAEAEVMLGALLRMRGSRDLADEHLDHARSLVEPLSDSYAKCYVLASLASHLLLVYSPDEAIATARAALEMAERLGLDELRVRTLATLGAARTTSGDVGGLRDLERSVAAATELNSAETVRSHLRLAATYAEFGDLARSASHLAAGRREAERFGLAHRLRWCRGASVEEHYVAARWDEAVETADEFIAECEAGSPHYLESWCRVFRGHIRLARGDQSGALEDASRALEAASRAKDVQLLFPALAFQGRVWLETGNASEGAACLDELLERWLEAGERLLAGRWAIDLAVVASDLDATERMAALAERSATRTRWLVAATALAQADYIRSADVCASIGSIPDEMFARLRACESLLETGQAPAADLELARSVAFFRRVGAVAHERRIENLLAVTD